MPTYEYRCEVCDHRFERFQKMSDRPVTDCEECGGEVQRVLFPVAVHFKGSGFYTTDYGNKKALKSGSGNGSEAEASGSGSESSENGSSEASSASAGGSEASGSKSKGDTNAVSSGA